MPLARRPLLPFTLAIGLGSAMAMAMAPAMAAEPRDAPASCVEVEVDGVRAPASFACLSERLRPSATPAQAREAAMGSEAIVQRPGNQLGVFNRAATSHRMGNTFGTSVYPQRPPPAVPVMPFGPRP